MKNSNFRTKYGKTTSLLFFLISTLTLTAQVPDTWTERSPLPGGTRFAAFAFSIGDKGYAGGGYNFSTGAFSDFWEYDPATDTWTERADFAAGGRSGAVAFSIGGKGYVTTGIDEASVKQNDTWEYDPVTDTWTEKADIPAVGRNYAVGFSVGSKGYMGTGYTDAGFVSLNDFWQYDPVADTWTEMPPLPGPQRSSATGFGLDGKGYIGTGDTCNDVACFALKDFYAFDTLTETWSAIADAGDFLRDGATAFTIGHIGYICAGNVDFLCTNDLIAYDPSDNSWTTMASIPGDARNTAIAFSIGDKAYAGTGFDDSFSATDNIFEYAGDSIITDTTTTDTTTTDTTIIDTTVVDTLGESIRFFAEHSVITIKPNPVSEVAEFILVSDINISEAELSLYSVQGVRISNDHIVKQTEDEHTVRFIFYKKDLPPGIYFFDLAMEQGSIRTGKIVVN